MSFVMMKTSQLSAFVSSLHKVHQPIWITAERSGAAISRPCPCDCWVTPYQWEPLTDLFS